MKVFVSFHPLLVITFLASCSFWKIVAFHYAEPRYTLFHSRYQSVDRRQHTSSLSKSTTLFHQSLESFRLNARKQIPVPPSRNDEIIRDYEVGPPPDLPSLLLQNRIVYIGMPLVPSVTELVIAQLLNLAYQGPTRDITLYINSPGTNSPDGRPFSFDTEAFAIADTLLFIPCPIRTVCVGQAYGTAAMLLGMGMKGRRFALPNASIMLHQPRSRARGQAVDVAIKAREIANNRKTTNEFLAKACGKDYETIDRDSSRVKYFSAEEAVEYGLIDAVLYPGSQAERENNLPKACKTELFNME